MHSMTIPQGPRNPNGYTAEEVHDVLRAVDGHRRITFRYELLDGKMERKRDLEHVFSGTVSQQYIAEIKRTATFELDDEEDIDYLHDHIKPYCRLWMPARWTVEHESPRWRWQNRFGGNEEVPDAAESDIDALGDDVTEAAGDLSLVLSPRINSSGSLGFGDGGGHIATSNQVTVESDRRRFRTYLYVQEGSGIEFSWFDEEGGVFGGPEGGFVVDGIGSEVRLADTDMGPGVYDTLVGKWVRVEIDFDYEDAEAEFRIYSSNPHGPDPDVEHTAPLTTDKRVFGFRAERASDDGSFPDSYLYLGPVSFGDLVVIPSRPDPTDRDFVEVPLGVFMLSTSAKNVDITRDVTRSIDGYDRTQLLIDDKLTERFVITKGENYTDVLNTLLADYPRIITPSTWVCGRTREFSVGTSIKEVADRIAESIDYHTVRFDVEGRLILGPYISPGDRTAEYHYTDDEYSIMETEAEVEFDTSEIANVWITSLNEADEKAVFIKLENTDPANPFSIPSRGRRIVDFREQEEGFDRASLLRKAKRIQFEANRVYENISFNTLINPFHDSNDCYTMDYGVAGVNNKYTEINWEFNLEAGGQMSHTCRRIVELDPELFNGFVDGHLQINGAATMSNMKWGMVTVSSHKPSQPTSVNVTGLGLTGTGPTHVFLTPVVSAGGLATLKASSVSSRTANGFKLWSYRTTSSTTDYYWFAVRDV